MLTNQSKVVTNWTMTFMLILNINFLFLTYEKTGCAEYKIKTKS